MKIESLYTCLSGLLLLISCQSLAVNIYAIDIEGLHQSDKKGAYDKIISAVLKSAPENYQLIVKDPESTDSAFANCSNCCMTPANNNKKFYSWGPDIKQSASMNWAKVYAFSAMGKDPITSVSQLKGKRVGIRSGMPYGTDVDKGGFNLIPSNTIAENIIKLENGQLDLFLAYVPDAYVTFKELNKKILPHAKKSPLAIHSDALVCKGVSTEFMNHFDAQLKALRKMGLIRRLLKDQYVKPL